MSDGRWIRIFVLILCVAFSSLVIISCTQSVAPIQKSNAPQQAVQQSVPKLPEGAISLDRNFYLIIDDSDSMADKKFAGSFPSRIEAAKWALEEFVTKAVPADVNLGLYALNSGKELVPLGKTREALISRLRKIRNNNGTPLNEAIRDSTNALLKQRSKQLGYGEFYIVVATDGEATDELASDASRGVEYARKNSIPIITIGFGIQNHPLKNQSLSYREATSPQELLQALKETQGESQYFDNTIFKKK